MRLLVDALELDKIAGCEALLCEIVRETVSVTISTYENDSQDAQSYSLLLVLLLAITGFGFALVDSQVSRPESSLASALIFLAYAVALSRLVRICFISLKSAEGGNGLILVNRCSWTREG